MATTEREAGKFRTNEIVVSSVSVRFSSGTSEVLALDKIDLKVRENEFLCVMGPSGCGKTTLLNAIAGFVRPTSGSIEIEGRPVVRAGPDRAVVFQADAVFPWMTVEENIGFSQRVRGKSEKEVKEVVDRYIELVGLENFRGAWPKELSGGMKKRVDLARGYAADPEVLLLDEPFGALDIMTKERLQEELRRLWLASPRTMIFITHDLEEALYLGDRVVVMSPRPGRIESVHEPNFPQERDLSFKLEDKFIEFRREVHKRMTAFSST
jgi:NitT/TauT family transport system ATP-binding protein